VALSSAAPSLAAHKVALSLLFVSCSRSRTCAACASRDPLRVPTYAFVVAFFVDDRDRRLEVRGRELPAGARPDPLAAGAGAVGVFVVLRAFASGAAALTGVESISNGVNAFRPPAGKNAARTLLIMGAIAITLFIGVSYLAVHMHARPSNTVSVVSEIARATFPSGSWTSFMYYAVQGLTFAILVLAANTSYQGFPRLGACSHATASSRASSSTSATARLLERDHRARRDRVVPDLDLPRGRARADPPLRDRRLHGVHALAGGMVRYWWRRRDPGWQKSVTLNAIGCAATGLVALLVIQAKFTAGAWAVIVAIPIMIVGFYGVHRHYRKVERRLRAGVAAVAAAPAPRNEVVLYVESADAALEEALWYARQIAGDDFRAIHPLGTHSDPGIRARFRSLTDIHPDLDVLEPPLGRVEAVIEYLWALPRGESNFVTVVIPELFRRRSLWAAASRRTELALKLRLLREPGVVITDVPVLADNGHLPLPHARSAGCSCPGHTPRRSAR
jgi:hypothetical protein